MAKARSTKTSNHQPQQINLPEATPLAIGRSIRGLVANRDGEGLILTIVSLMARCEAKLIKGSNVVTKKSLRKWNDWAFLNLRGYQVLSCAENLASDNDDESLGSIYTKVIVETVIKISNEKGNQNESYFYVWI